MPFHAVRTTRRALLVGAVLTGTLATAAPALAASAPTLAVGAPALASAAEPTGSPVTATVQTRDPLAWPFARDSIWNTPIGSRARYVPAGLQAANEASSDRVTADPEHISLDPRHPLRTLSAPGQAGHGAGVRVAPDLAHDGSWNGCSTLLTADGRSIWQGQPLRLTAGGNPTWRWTTQKAPIDLRGGGIEGCHGGSRMSGLGGSLRVGELSSPAPLRHALKVNLYCKKYCYRGTSQSDSKRWPAFTSDAYWASGYGGRLPALRMGALLAVPPGTDLRGITHPKVRKMALAFRDYGGYLVDDTAWDVHAVDMDKRLVTSGEWPKGSDTAFHAQLQKVFRMLAVVDNNSPTSIGGGGTRRAPLAPCFADDAACLKEAPAAAQPPASGGAAVPDDRNTTRFAGADRYTTAAAVSRGSFPASTDDVFLVSGTNWPDALSAGPAAASLAAPVLPVRVGAVPAPVLTELARLTPRRAWIIGGPSAVSDAVASSLRARGIAVTRISGADRYATAAAVASRFLRGAPGAYYTSGASYSDALGGGAAAAQRGWPLLLTAKDRLPASTPVLGSQRIVLGGPAAISESVRARLGARRVAGKDRYSTAAAIARDAFPQATVTFLATGLDFPDALAGAPAAARADAPLLLTAKDCVTSSTRQAITALGGRTRVVLGGTVVVSGRASTLTTC